MKQLLEFLAVIFDRFPGVMEWKHANEKHKKKKEEKKKKEKNKKKKNKMKKNKKMKNKKMKNKKMKKKWGKKTFQLQRGPPTKRQVPIEEIKSPSVLNINHLIWICNDTVREKLQRTKSISSN